jgi:hypothetical protein
MTCCTTRAWFSTARLEQSSFGKIKKFEGSSIYCPSKGKVDALTKALALESVTQALEGDNGGGGLGMSTFILNELRRAKFFPTLTPHGHPSLPEHSDRNCPEQGLEFNRAPRSVARKLDNTPS